VEQGAGRDLVLANDRLQVEGDADRRVLGDDTTVVGGAATLEADEIILRANQRIVLEVGGNRVLLDGAGIAVEASGGSVAVTGAEEVDVSGVRRVRSVQLYANADSASRTSIFATLVPSLTPAAATAAWNSLVFTSTSALSL